MTYDELKYKMESMPEILAYYISYKETENITTNVHGEYPGEFEKHMAHIVEIAEVKSDLPIERIVFYHDGNANAYVRNELWDRVDGDGCDSHIHINIPYIGPIGSFYEFSNLKEYVKDLEFYNVAKKFKKFAVEIDKEKSVAEKYNAKFDFDAFRRKTRRSGKGIFTLKSNYICKYCKEVCKCCDEDISNLENGVINDNNRDIVERRQAISCLGKYCDQPCELQNLEEEVDKDTLVNTIMKLGERLKNECSGKKITISKDGRNISDFANEKEALMWFAQNEGVEVCYETQGK